MSDRRVTVFGGTGFLGRQIAERLAAGGWQVSVAVRHPEGAHFPKSGQDGGEITCDAADIRDEAAVARVLAGAEAAVNAVGLYLERADETFQAVHVEGAALLARQAGQAGLARLVHISGIGADPASPSRYVRARADGEAAVRAAFPAATILRPSVLFGPQDAFLTSLVQMLRLSPVMPLFGDGGTKLQPVYVGDVAEAVAGVLETPAAVGTLYELGGPDVFSYAALLRLLLARMGRRCLLLPLPFFFWEAIAAAARLLPSPPLTRDQIALMRRDNLVAEDAAGFAELGITPHSVEDILPALLGPGR